MAFQIEAFHNPYLPVEGRRLDAILTVTAHSEGATTSGEAVEALILDTSGSMQGERLASVKSATRQAIEMLGEQASFFVIAFSSDASLVAPLARATPQNKARAIEAVRGLDASGGTRLSRGLSRARQEFARAPGIRHALFLTDGKNDPGDEAQLQTVLAECEGVFQCDCRGVGTDWQTSQLRAIAERLLGTAQIIAEPSKVEADFRDTMGRALSRGVGDVRLRLWTPRTARLLSVKQTSPELADLTARGVAVDGQTADYPTGAWGNESRDYHITIEVEPGVAGDEMLACRPSIVWEQGGVTQKSPPALVLATWTDDSGLSARISPQVAHYTGQAELAETIRLGLEARTRGAQEEATTLLGRAVQLAHASGNAETTQRLSRVVDVVNPEEGTVRLKAGASRADEMDLDLMSTRTKRAARPANP